MNDIFLGIDTSNYTTSAAVTDSDGNILSDRRKLLSVKKGERGLRQQEAVFQHIKNFPYILADVASDVDMQSIKAVSVSAFPRNIPDSYMPCFEAGKTFARSIGTSLNIPVYEFSHQEGHIRAVTDMDECICFHLSGGTTEILKVDRSDKTLGYETQIIGRTLDISFGQLIDRIGVAMGFDFPAGAAIDNLALNADTESSIKGLKPFYTDGTNINLSGAETQFCRIIPDHTFEQIAFTLMEMTAACLEKLIKACKEKYPERIVVLAGGVSQSRFIRNRLKGIAIFGKYSTDNAIGISLLGGGAYAFKTCKSQSAE